MAGLICGIIGAVVYFALIVLMIIGFVDADDYYNYSDFSNVIIGT
ncbi:hypothetical protein [Cohnella sp. GbtcB17]|nr:hypothetical protein [Cohnella sp. GbtcB17]